MFLCSAFVILCSFIIFGFQFFVFTLLSVLYFLLPFSIIKIC